MNPDQEIINLSASECDHPSLFLPFVEAITRQLDQREYWQELERVFIALLRALSQEFGDKGSFRLCLTGSGARRVTADSWRYRETRQYFRQIWRTSNFDGYDVAKGNVTDTQKRAKHAVSGCLRDDYDFVLILYNNELLERARSVVKTILASTKLFKFSEECVPTNLAVPIFRSKSSKISGLDIHMFMLTVWGQDPLILLDNRLGNRVPSISQHTATLLIDDGKLVFLRQELERITARLDTTNYIKYQPGLDPFTQFELFLRMVRMKYLYNPQMSIDESLWLKICDHEINQILTAVSVKLGWLFLHPEDLNDPVTMEQFCLFLRELLVIKHIGALPELFLNGDSNTWRMMEIVINLLALIQKKEKIGTLENMVSHGVLMQQDEQAFAQWLLGVPWGWYTGLEPATSAFTEQRSNQLS